MISWDPLSERQQHMTAITTGDGPVVRIADAGPRPEPDAGGDSRVVRVGSTGVPGVEPLVAVTLAGRTAFHARCSAEEAESIASSVDETGDVTAATPDAVVDHDPNATRLPTPQLSGLSTGVRDVLGACGWRRPTEPADHEAAGGFADADPAAVLAAGETLRGRGWGDSCQDTPVAETWHGVREADDEATVVVNAHGNDADTLLLASAPFEVLEGAVSVARTVGADRIVVYASEAAERAVETCRAAIDRYPAVPVDVEVVTGPAVYRAAEPTMAIEAIEGNHRLEARIRPPGPDEVGLHGRPTLVHTPRTVAHLAVALRDGEVRGTRLLSVTGDVATPATVELPERATVAAAVDAVEVTGEIKAAAVGGRFGGVTGDLDVGVDADSLRAADLGTEGVVHVLGDDRCVVAFVGRRTQFAAAENCGRCVPCREGTTQLVDLLRDVYDGAYDPDGIAELIDVMRTSSLCAFGVRAGRPTRTALASFDAEFEAHANGRCPAGSCTETLEG
jgi:NADH-quinone oxidoreductase subunit F